MIDQSAALPRGARRAEKRIGDHDERERIEQARACGREVPRGTAWLLLELRVVRIGPEQFPEVAFAHRVLMTSSGAGRSATGRTHSGRTARCWDRAVWPPAAGCCRFPATGSCRASFFRISPCSARIVTRSFSSRRSSSRMPISRPLGCRSRIWKASPRSIWVKRPGCTMLLTRSARTSTSHSRSMRKLFGRDIGAHREQQQRDKRR